MSSDAQIGDDDTRGPLDGVGVEWYETLRHPRRIRVLEALSTEASPVTLMDLTTAIVERESFDVSNGQARYDVRISLVHNHLPRLAECGLLEWDGETASLADDTALPLDRLSALLESCDAEDETRILEILVHPVRTQLYSILRERDRPCSLEELASELTACDAGSLSNPRDATIALSHIHLPALADIGLIEFDRESGLVRRSDRSVPLLTR